jgi:hypothetical protein
MTRAAEIGSEKPGAKSDRKKRIRPTERAAPRIRDRVPARIDRGPPDNELLAA